MTSEQLESLLQLWGRVFGESPPREWDEPNGCSPIARIQKPSRNAQHVPGAWTRGKSRLSTMGQVAGLRTVPAWAADPVRGHDDSGGAGSAFDLRMTAEVQQVQDAWMALHRFHARHAEVVRVQYQVRGLSQTEKAKGLGIARRQYQEILSSGKLWIHARIAD